MGAKELTWDFTLSHWSTTGNKNFQDRIRAVKTISVQSLSITRVHYLNSVLPHPDTQSNVALFPMHSTHVELLWTRSKSPSYWIKWLNQSYCRASVKAGSEGRLPSWLQNQRGFFLKKVQLVPGLRSQALTQTHVLTHGSAAAAWQTGTDTSGKGPRFPNDLLRFSAPVTLSLHMFSTIPGSLCKLHKKVIKVSRKMELVGHKMMEFPHCIFLLHCNVLMAPRDSYFLFN